MCKECKCKECREVELLINEDDINEEVEREVEERIKSLKKEAIHACLIELGLIAALTVVALIISLV